MDNDTLKGEEPYTIAEITDPKYGSVTVDHTNNTITYTSDKDSSENDYFDYMVCNSNIVAGSNPAIPDPGCAIARVWVTVNAVNDAPIARNDLAVTEYDGNVTIAVLSNDSDIEDNLDVTTLKLVGTPSNGTVADPVDGDFTFTPTASTGYGNFHYEICDSEGECTSALVTIHINGEPLAVNDAITMNEDETIDANRIVDVLGNDTTPGTHLLQVEDFSQPAHGTATLIDGNATTNDTIKYVPNENWHGTDSFTYMMCNAGGICRTASVSVTVNEVNDPMVARDDLADTIIDSSVTIDVVANDFDMENDINPGSVTVTAGPAKGTKSVNPQNGKITYTPNAGYTGSDSFTYQICDSGSACVNAQVTIYIHGEPEAVDDTDTTDEDSPKEINVLLNDNEVRSPNPLQIADFTQPGHGTTTKVDADTLKYEPHTHWNGTDSFSYKICIAVDICDTAIVTMTVNAVNDPMVAKMDLASTIKDSSVIIDVAANDRDVEDDIDLSSITVIADPDHGSVDASSGDGKITYTPTTDYVGPDELTYQICESQGVCVTAVVGITINEASVAQSISKTIDEDIANGQSIDLLANGPAEYTVSEVADPGHGNLSRNGNTVTYTPHANWNGADSFTYKICNAAALCDTATVSLTVNPINDQPVANDDLVDTMLGAGVSIDVAANDRDVENGLGSPTVTANPTKGSTSVNAGKITYTPNASAIGLDSFTYQLCDSGSNCDDAQVTIYILGEPVAEDDAITMDEDENDEGSKVIDVLLNDTRITGTLEIAGYTQPGHGTTTKVDADTLKYQPYAHWNGTDRFTYKICNGTEVCDTAVVQVTVNSLNDDPIARDDVAVLPKDGSVLIDVLVNDVDIDNSAVPSVEVTDTPSYGSSVVNPLTGAITYILTTDPGADQSDQFTYQICDSANGCATAIVSIHLNGKLEAVDDTGTVDEDKVGGVDIDVIGLPDVNDTTPGTNPLQISHITQPVHGTTVDNGDGTINYRPQTDWNGEDKFAYMVCDAGGVCQTATVTVTVNPVNDDPIAQMDLVVIENTVIICCNN